MPVAQAQQAVPGPPTEVVDNGPDTSEWTPQQRSEWLRSGLRPGETGATHEVAYVASPPAKRYELPTLEQAIALMWDAQREYSAALVVAHNHHLAWGHADNLSSRERFAATLRLMGAMKLSSTAADKIATQDAVYAAFRDRLAKLLDAKLGAEAAVSDALSRLISARVTVEALTAQQRNIVVLTNYAGGAE